MFFKTTIDSIIGDITRKVAKLKTLSTKHTRAALQHQEDAATSTKLANEHVDNSIRADAIASKLAALVSP